MPDDVLTNEPVSGLQTVEGLGDFVGPVALVFPGRQVGDTDAMDFGSVGYKPVALGIEIEV